MRKPFSILVLCVLLGFCVSLVVPAEDVPETAYDESEALPYVSSSMFSVAVPKPVVPAPGVRGVAALLRPGSLRRFATQRFEQGTCRTYPICNSLTILDHSFRC